MHAAGIIHRDIKPGNLILSKDRGYLQLIDFGLAEETMTGQHCSACIPHDDILLAYVGPCHTVHKQTYSKYTA